MARVSNFFTEQLRKAMFERRLTQKELADMLDISQARISGWFTGYRNPSLSSIKKICEALKLPINFFVENSGGVVNSGVIGGDVSVSSLDGKDIKILQLEKEILELKLKLNKFEKKKMRRLK